MTISEYIKNVGKRYKTGISREHSYRGDLQNLLEGMFKNVLVTNEPARIDCGAPDFILTHKDVPIGYIEAKDIGEPLSGKKHKEQFSRYKESLDNLIFTDYLDFHFYREGEFVTSVRLAEIAGDAVRAVPENEEKFRQMINDFARHSLQTIKSASKLSKMMATKARLLSEIIERALKEDDGRAGSDTSLRSQLSAFQSVLMHDIDEKEFADIYAQTIAYGMFAARLHDKNLETFSRFEAARLIPKSNPFLRKLFQYIAGYDLDERIDWVVDALADIFRATDVDGLLNNFGKSTQQTDPVIHFYETFLAEFDPKLRKKRGVWYTPDPVVNFIIRAVDDILISEFGLKDGLADTSKTTVKVKVPTHDKRHKENMVFEEREVHKVQLLDPVAGTGTFLAEVIKQIYKKFEGQQGIWPDYVENHLIPRLNGFEILMASYAMTHLKLDLLLKETGYDRESTQRFRVYLTNSLEEHHPDTGTLFAGWLSNEANEANHIKRDTPVMVVFGNPPYSVSSSNKSEWIEELMQDYKIGLNERNINPLSDDYLKFTRFGQHFIEKNGEGILAFISNNSFLDGIIHRQVRRNLLNTFDKIYILDLHGSSNKKEKSPDGSSDQNVFDIMQGVSINIFVKNSTTQNQTNVYHQDFFGTRIKKYDRLIKNSIKTIEWVEVEAREPEYYLVPKNFTSKSTYEIGFSVKDLFKMRTSGIKTHRDQLVTDFTYDSLKEKISVFFNKDVPNKEFLDLFNLKEKDGWLNDNRRGDIEIDKINKISFRPFDEKYIYYSKNLIDRDREKVMSHVIGKENFVALFPRQAITEKFGFFMTDKICDINFTGTAGQYGAGLAFPLYQYSKNDQQTLDGTPERKPNLDPKIVKKIAEGLGLTFTPEKEDRDGTFAPIDLLDYIYTVLHSPTYRETYKEFLKIDFPRVPYPDDPEQFWKLVELGSKLRQIHLLEHPVVNEYITTYTKTGSNEVTRKITSASPGFILEKENKEIGKVWINDVQYFGNVPLKAWEFYIGGYQPAQKWLKDRRGRTLSMEEIQHYQKIIVALVETKRLMREIDGVLTIDN